MSRAALAAVLLLAATAAAAQTPGDRAAWPRTDFSKRSVDLAQIDSGGPPKDGIPAIDRPRFTTIAAANAWLKPNEPVIALRIGARARAYPIQILMFHEIVNDTLDGVPVAVTFCPLCNASIVFDRRMSGSVLDFGTTGKLRFSDLVMYDRQSESWWQQFTGKGIVGKHSGVELVRVPSAIVAFADFAAAHPAGEVLSRDTGFERPYGRNPYAGYDRVGQSPFLLRGKPDARLPPMERVLSVTVAGRHRLYPLGVLERHPVTNGSLQNFPYVVFAEAGMASPLDAERIAAGRPIPAAAAYGRQLGRRVLEFTKRDGERVDLQTGSRWNILGEATAGPLKGERLPAVDSGVHFAFAWLAFNPQTEIMRSLP